MFRNGTHLHTRPRKITRSLVMDSLTIARGPASRRPSRRALPGQGVGQRNCYAAQPRHALAAGSTRGTGGTARMRGAAGRCSLGGRIAPAIAVLLTWSAQRVWQTEQQTQESSVKEDTLQAIKYSYIALNVHAVEHDDREPSCRIHRNATRRERPHDTDKSSCAAVARAASRSLCRAT